MALTSQVFVSHTSDMELFPAGRSFVQAVLDGIGRAGLAAVDMRHFAAREGTPVEYCRQQVRECEFYVARGDLRGLHPRAGSADRRALGHRRA